MKKIICLTPIILPVILLLPLVLAVDILTQKEDYSLAETVSITISNCEGSSLLLLNNPSMHPVYVRQGQGAWETSYNTLSDSAEGRYSLTVNCADGTTKEKSFCVNAPSCAFSSSEYEVIYIRGYVNHEREYSLNKEGGNVTLSKGDELSFKVKVSNSAENRGLNVSLDGIIENINQSINDIEADESRFTVGSKESANGWLYFSIPVNASEGGCELDLELTFLWESGEQQTEEVSFIVLVVNESGENEFISREICTPYWQCSPWSYCNAGLQQVRVCKDQNNCTSQRIEQESCQRCVEDWVCGEWSACREGKQIRSCTDQHKCGTKSERSSLEKSCPKPPPQKSAELPAAPFVLPEEIFVEKEVKGVAVVHSPKVSFWEEYQYAFLISLLVLFFLVLLFVLILLYQKLRSKPSPRLVSYIRREKEKGFSNARIKSALLRAGWKLKDIKKALK